MLYNLFVACALIFNQYANPIALTAIKWKCMFSRLLLTSSMGFNRYPADYIVYDVWLLVELIVVYLLFVETSGSSLEEMAAIIDGEEVRATIIEAVAKVADGKMDNHQEDVLDDKRPAVNVA